MDSFDYFIGVSVCELVLSHGDNLSTALQSSTISVAKTIDKLRTNKIFSLFWDLVQTNAAVVHVAEPRLSRRRKVPQRYGTGKGTANYSSTVEVHYCHSYFEVLDYVVAAIKARFDQPCYAYKQVEDLLVKTVREDSSVELISVKDLC